MFAHKIQNSFTPPQPFYILYLFVSLFESRIQQFQNLDCSTVQTHRLLEGVLLVSLASYCTNIHIMGAARERSGESRDKTHLPTLYSTLYTPPKLHHVETEIIVIVQQCAIVPQGGAQFTPPCKGYRQEILFIENRK